MDKQDNELNIYTGGLILKYADEQHRIYQPTPYDVLDKIIESGHITSKDILVDYGCGRGRVCFYLSDKIGCTTIGVEYAEPIYTKAIDNLKAYAGDKNRISFLCMAAENYIPEDATTFFMFNPFGGEIFEMVFENIQRYTAQKGDSVKLILYSPDVWTAEFMREREDVKKIDEIDVRENKYAYPFKKIFFYEMR